VPVMWYLGMTTVRAFPHSTLLYAIASYIPFLLNTFKFTLEMLDCLRLDSDVS
jgi:hypothetical protein